MGDVAATSIEPLESAGTSSASVLKNTRLDVDVLGAEITLIDAGEQRGRHAQHADLDFIRSQCRARREREARGPRARSAR